MSRRGRLDALVVGGGVVGCAAALALARQGLDVALIEAQSPPPWSAGRRDLRVYAFAADNAALLQSLGVWPAIRDARAQRYRRMRVWDAAGGGELVFDADALARPELGWIVEHGLLVDRLWHALAPAGVRVVAPARAAGLEPHDDGVRVRLDDGTALDARLLLAADGAESAVRALAGFDVERHAYAQKGLVAYVASECPHEDTAWQRFLPTGPLALLPFVRDVDGAHVGSIVWTLLGLHTVHVVTDVVDTIVLAVMFFTAPLDANRFVDASESAFYWYFVVFTWLPIYGLLYITPRFI